MLAVHEPDPEAMRRACELIPGPLHRIRAIREKPSIPEGRLRGCALYLFRGERFHELVRQARTYAAPKCVPDIVAAAARRRAASYFKTRGRNINVNTLVDLKSAWEAVGDLAPTLL